MTARTHSATPDGFAAAARSGVGITVSLVVVALAAACGSSSNGGRTTTLGHASRSLNACLRSHGAHATKEAEVGAWRVTFPDGRSGKFYFKDVAPDGMSSSLIPSFDKTQEVVGIHYRGSNVKTVDACANAAHLSF